MNYRSLISTTFLMIFGCLHTNIHCSNLNERQDAIKKTHKHLLKKWNPVLNNLTEERLFTIINNKIAYFKARLIQPFNTQDKEKLTALLRDIEAWPLRFICEELDHDIHTLFRLEEEINRLNMDYTINTIPFQNVRAQIETLPCYQQEQLNMDNFVELYKKYYAILCVATIAYCVYKSGVTLPSIFGHLPTCEQ